MEPRAPRSGFRERQKLACGAAKANLATLLKLTYTGLGIRGPVAPNFQLNPAVTAFFVPVNVKTGI
jgi:hypothetical protein